MLLVDISLEQEGRNAPAMWFLGVPPTPRIALTFQSPGPITLDFDDLSEPEKRHVLVSLNMQRIRTSISYADLLKNFFSDQGVSEENKEVQQLVKDNDAKQQATEQARILQIQRADAIETKCNKLLKLKLKQLKEAISKEKDVKVLKKLLFIEKSKPEKKQRMSVIEAINDSLGKFQEEVIQEIERNAAAQPVVDPFRPRDTIKFEVEETDQEIVKFALGAPLQIEEEE